MYSKILSVAIAVMALSPGFAQERLKILALHGGGSTPNGFKLSRGMRDLEEALPEFEFVYAEGGYPTKDDGKRKLLQKRRLQKDGGFLWIPDPPNKNQPTTSPKIADDSLANLNQILEEQGPFYGLLGYSQGGAFVSVYLSKLPPGTFEKAMIFCGYRTTTHLGLLDGVNEESPFGDIPALIWIGKFDFIIRPKLSRELIPLFKDPTKIESPSGTHAVPGTNDPTFDDVVDFIRDDNISTPPPVECVDTDTRCSKAAKNPRKRCKRIFQGQSVSTICPKTCGLCD
jgi:predicted esterase